MGTFIFGPYINPIGPFERPVFQNAQWCQSGIIQIPTLVDAKESKITEKLRVYATSQSISILLFVCFDYYDQDLKTCLYCKRHCVGSCSLCVAWLVLTRPHRGSCSFFYGFFLSFWQSRLGMYLRHNLTDHDQTWPGWQLTLPQHDIWLWPAYDLWPRYRGQKRNFAIKLFNSNK